MPGRCPSCNQNYTDETLSFCPNDGTPLIKEAPSSYDPQATMISQPPPVYPQQQGGYYPTPGGQAPPQGGQTPPPGWQQPPPYEQQPPYGQQPPPYGQQQQYQPQYGATSDGGGKSKLPIIIAIAAVILIGGGIGLYFLLRDNSTSSSTASSNNSAANTSNVSRTSTSSTPSTITVATPSTTTSTTTTTTTADNYSDDEKHKLFQAVGITHDEPLIIEVAQKLGLADSRGQATPAMQPFIKDHFNWAMRSAAWVQEYKDPQKAREYVMAHK